MIKICCNTFIKKYVVKLNLKKIEIFKFKLNHKKNLLGVSQELLPIPQNLEVEPVRVNTKHQSS